MIPQTDSGFSPARRKPAKPTVGKWSETKFQHSGQGFPEDSGDPWVKYRQPLQQKPHKNDSEMSGLLKAKNQSMRGNGRKQYQDSPNQKKRTNGVHSQPAKQQNSLMVRVCYLMLIREFTLFKSGARHCQGTLN